MRISRMYKPLAATLLLPLLIWQASCGGQGAVSDVPGEKGSAATQAPTADIVRIVSPADNSRFASGAVLDLKLAQAGDIVPDSISVFLDGKMMVPGGDDPMSFPLSTEGTRLGRVPLKVVAYASGYRPQTITHFLLILSDIVPKRQGYRVVNRYPHDPAAYTQGLLVHQGFFYESTGQEGKSSLRKVEISSGEVLREHRLESKYFGEGLVHVGGKLYQLTWQHNTGFVYDLETFSELRRIHYDTQGWGLTSHGDVIFMSDGTNRIYLLEPEYFTVTGSFEVYDNERAVYQLNELEYINGELWANIYMTDLIARIDPSTGKVLAYVDLSNLVDKRALGLNSEQVLNGIAWDSEANRLFVTGKDWPWLFEITVR